MPKRGSLIHAAKQLRKKHQQNQNDKRRREKEQQRQQQQKAEKKKLHAKMPYTPEQTILLVGEGNFSFSVALISNFAKEAAASGMNLCATSLDSKELLYEKYGKSNLKKNGAEDDESEAKTDNEIENNLLLLADNGVKIVHDIDATKLNVPEVYSKLLLRNFDGKAAKHMAAPKFDRIVFNFPHLGLGIKDEARNVEKHQQLLREFAVSALAVLARPAGQIHLTVKEGKPYDLWQVPKTILGAAKGQLKLHSAVPFYPHLYPGYRHRRTLGYEQAVSFDANEDIINGAKTYVFTWFDAPTKQQLEQEAKFKRKREEEEGDDDAPIVPAEPVATVAWDEDEDEETIARQKSIERFKQAQKQQPRHQPMEDDDDEGNDEELGPEFEADDLEGDDDDDDVADDDDAVESDDETERRAAKLSAATAAAASVAHEQRARHNQFDTSSVLAATAAKPKKIKPLAGASSGINLFYGLEKGSSSLTSENDALEKALVGMADSDDDIDLEGGASGDDLDFDSEAEEKDARGRRGPKPAKPAAAASKDDKNKPKKLLLSNRSKRKHAPENEPKKNELKSSRSEVAALEAARKVAKAAKLAKLAKQQKQPEKQQKQQQKSAQPPSAKPPQHKSANPQRDAAGRAPAKKQKTNK